MSLADAQDLPEAGVPGLNLEERARMRNVRFPGDPPPDANPFFYPRKPKENVKQWFADHAEKLRSLERAAKG